MTYYYEPELYHHGIKGQKWGVRRFQNEDGSLTPAGEERYLVGDKKEKAPSKESIDKYREKMIQKYSGKDFLKGEKYKQLSDAALASEMHRRKVAKAVLISSIAAVGVGAGLYIAYKNDAFSRFKELTEKSISDESSEKIKSAVNKAMSVSDESSEKIKWAMSKAMSDAAEDMDFCFEEGSEIHRMVGSSGYDLQKEIGKMTYVAASEADRATYASLLKDWSKTGQRYDVSFKVAKEIRLPSDKRAHEIFDKLYNENPEYRKSLIETLIRVYKPSYDNESESTKELVKKLIERQVDANPFKHGMYSIVKQQADSKLLKDEFIKAGYSAITDYFDKGDLGERPIILFDAPNQLIKTGEKFVSPTKKVEYIHYLATMKSHPMYETAKDLITKYSDITLSKLL